MFLLYFAAPEPHMVGFEYAEHGRLGDRLKLYNTDGSVSIAWTKPFMLPNGLKVTYGQINGLGGDFYGTAAPISDGIDFQDSVSRFLTAFHWLASDETRNPGEATEILNVLQQEVDLVNKAIDGKTDPSVFYAKYDKDETATFERITLSRPDGVPGYIGLAQINWDHFGHCWALCRDSGSRQRRPRARLRNECTCGSLFGRLILCWPYAYSTTCSAQRNRDC